MGYSPTKVNPEKFNSLGTTYSFVTYASQLIKEFSLPDGKYYLKSLLFTQTSGYTPNEYDYTNPLLYLFNSDNKWTGIYLRAKILDKNNKPIKFDLTPEKQILDLIASKGINDVKIKKNQKFEITFIERLISLYSVKLKEQVEIDPYPSYTSIQNDISKTSGIIVSGDTNQPIKGATIEKTD